MVDLQVPRHGATLFVTDELSQRIVERLRPHTTTLTKLMRVKRCRSRHDMMRLGVSRRDLLGLLHLRPGHADAQSDDMVLKDVDLAKALGVTSRRWSYVKRLLLDQPPPSSRALKQRALDQKGDLVTLPCYMAEQVGLTLA